jgi:hypothetical protein
MVNTIQRSPAGVVSSDLFNDVDLASNRTAPIPLLPVCVKQSYAERNPEIYWQSMLSITPVTPPKLVRPNSSHLQSENHCFIPVQRPHIIAPLLPIARCSAPIPPNLSLRFTNGGLAPAAAAAAGFLSPWRSAGNGDWRPTPYVFRGQPPHDLPPSHRSDVPACSTTGDTPPACSKTDLTCVPGRAATNT